MRPIYQHNPIGSKNALAKKLKITEYELDQLLKISDSLYHANAPEPKSDGSFRQTYRVEPRLKIILSHIVTNIFHHVRFPSYIQGSVKDLENPRDYISNAKIHAGKKLLIKEDLKNFFPSITSLQVKHLWLRLFRFSPEVSEALTKLTTLNNFVPQGAPTSSYLANVIFWDLEPAVVAALSKQDITYTRYVDDITLSTNRRLTIKEKTEAIGLVYGMCLKKGIKPNRKKHFIVSSGNNMVVHGLNVNTSIPTLPQSEKLKIRAAVYECKKRHSEESMTLSYKKLYEQTMGRAQRLNRLQPAKAQSFLAQLKIISPKF